MLPAALEKIRGEAEENERRFEALVVELGEAELAWRPRPATACLPTP